MINRGYIFLGGAVLLAGVMLLITTLTDVDLCQFCWPAGLIALGLLILLRPRMVRSGTGVIIRLLGDVRRSGAWNVADEEIWVIIGDVSLDLSQAFVPAGETRIRVLGFVGSVRVIVPETIGLAVASTAFVTDVTFLGHKTSNVLNPYVETTDGYDEAGQKVMIENFHFVGDVKVKRPS